MKIRFASTARFNDNLSYSFNGQAVTVTLGELSETLDFTALEDGVTDETEDSLFPSKWLRKAKKEAGEVYLILYQNTGSGHWQHYSDWLDTADYDDSATYLERLTSPDATEYGSNLWSV